MQVSIVQKSRLENISQRLDAEYYKPEYLTLVAKIKQKGFKPLNKLGTFVVGPFGSAFTVNNYVKKSNFRYVRGKDIKTYFIEDNDNAYLPEEHFKRLQKYSLSKDDLLITVVGTLGNSSIVCNEIPAIFSCKSTVFKSKVFDPKFVLAYLNTEYGKKLLLRSSRGAVQTGLNLDDLKNLLVFSASKKFQFYISELITSARKHLDLSTEYFFEAENIILQELGLKDWEPYHELTFEKKYSDVWKENRFDADYFQPKYDELFNHFKKNYQCKKLYEITSVIGHPSNPPYSKAGKGCFILTQKHLGKFFPKENFYDSENSLYTTEEFIAANQKYLLQKNDVLLYSVGAYIGKANLFKNSVNATIGSFLTLIRTIPEEINPYYLCLLLNSKIGVMLTKRYQRGMAQQYVYPFDIKNFLIPIINRNVQTQVENKINMAEHERQKSKSFLKITKGGVEKAIEKNESIATRWIQDQTKGLINA